MAKEKPYWLEERGEICSECEHPHSHHVGAHCAACDARLCIFCITFASGETFCTVCGPQAAKPKKAKKQGRVRRWLQQRGRSGKA